MRRALSIMGEGAGAVPRERGFRSNDLSPCATPWNLGDLGLGDLAPDTRIADPIHPGRFYGREARLDLRGTRHNKLSQRLPTRLTGPPRFIGVPARTPTPGAPTPGVTTARATGRATSTTPGLATHPTG